VKRYCAVCLEALEKRFYERLEPIDDFGPRQAEVAIARDEIAKFDVTALQIESGAGEKFGSFAAKWYVDGKPAQPTSSGIKSALDVRGAQLSPGEHQVCVRVELKDARVRRDDG